MLAGNQCIIWNIQLHVDAGRLFSFRFHEGWTPFPNDRLWRGVLLQKILMFIFILFIIGIIAFLCRIDAFRCICGSWNTCKDYLILWILCMYGIRRCYMAQNKASNPTLGIEVQFLFLWSIQLHHTLYVTVIHGIVTEETSAPRNFFTRSFCGNTLLLHSTYKS